MSDPRWTALIENRLAEHLCKEAHDGIGVCGDHLRLSRAALAHLADAGLLATTGSAR